MNSGTKSCRRRCSLDYHLDNAFQFGGLETEDEIR
jgi:hypothetical protein